MRAVSLLLTVAAFASAQVATQRETFEVASVKPSARSSTTAGSAQVGSLRGGPGTATPTSVTGNGVTLLTLIRAAYGLAADQVSGPDWLDEFTYDINARATPGATRAEFQLMLQDLLVRRFQLRVHKESRELAIYELTVTQAGHHLKETQLKEATPLQPGDIQMPPKLDTDGFPVMPEGRAGKIGFSRRGSMFRTFRAEPVSSLTAELSRELGRIVWAHTMAPARVVDKTGLTARYDFRLWYASSGRIGGASETPLSTAAAPDNSRPDDLSPGGPDLQQALERQLGLKLVRARAVFDVFVVDRIERTPTEN
jgi:uncharacterized protein (TIGR03435 family)